MDAVQYFRPHKNCEPLFQEPVYSVESSSILGVRTTGIPSHVPAVALKASCFQAAVSGRAPAGMLQLSLGHPRHKMLITLTLILYFVRFSCLLGTSLLRLLATLYATLLAQYSIGFLYMAYFSYSRDWTVKIPGSSHY